MEELEGQKIIRQYLLGELGEASSERLEEKVLTDPEYEEQVSAVEDELIEDFVTDELTGSEREQFVKHFLSTPHQRQRLSLAKDIHNYFGQVVVADPSPAVNETPRVPFWTRWAAALPRGPHSFAARAVAVGLTLTLAGGAVFLAWRYLRSRPDAFQQELTRLNDPHRSDEELLKSYPSFRVSLTSDFVRGGEGMPKIQLPAATKVVRFELPRAQYPSYRADLQTPGAKETLTLPTLAPRALAGNSVLVINVPIELLPQGDYELNLTGVSADGLSTKTDSYYFRIMP